MCNTRRDLDFFTSSHLIILSGLRSIEFFNNQL